MTTNQSPFNPEGFFAKFLEKFSLDVIMDGSGITTQDITPGARHFGRHVYASFTQEFVVEQKTGLYTNGRYELNQGTVDEPGREATFSELVMQLEGLTLPDNSNLPAFRVTLKLETDYNSPGQKNFFTREDKERHWGIWRKSNHSILFPTPIFLSKRYHFEEGELRWNTLDEAS